METKVTSVETIKETVLASEEKAVQFVSMPDKSLILEQAKVIEVVTQSEQGPAGAKGENGLGIDNFEGDPVLVYMLARG